MGGGRCRRWLARALAWALALQLLLAPPAAEALTWRLPGRAAPAPTRPGGGAGPSRPREVPPPAWVRTVQASLEERDPQVRILAPADGALLPEGPWTLRLRVADWPLVDAGPLGLGPHLVAQLDGEPPRPLVRTEVEMPPLSPGSHLLTVYAAKPWGEAHKSPTALHQIRLHRLAANPATLPAPGTPQLVPVSPMGPAGAPPLLLDWLLIDAPLQGLRTEASGWRLRATLNGESVLLDQQVPIWLEGWQPGGNALLLELLDGRGEPLNPPFNSLLREVVVSASGGLGRPGSPALTDLEMAVLLGEQPLSALNPAPPPPSEPDLAAAPEEVQPPAPAPQALPESPAPEPNQASESELAAAPVASPPSEDQAKPSAQPPASGPAQAPPSSQPEEPTPLPSSAPPPPDPLRADPPAPPPEDDIAASSVPAQAKVNADGALKRPSRPSPLAWPRERLQR